MADDVEPGPSPLSAKMENTDIGDATLMDLPPEVLRGILMLPSLDVKDVSSLGQTCQKMNALITDDCNDVWRTKHLQRWPDANNVILETSSVNDWYAECKRAVNFSHITFNLMEEVWPKVYAESEVCYSHFSPFRKIMEEDPTAYYYIKEYLMSLVWDGNLAANMTQKYHAKRLLRYIRQEYLTKLWKDYIALPEDKQLLEVGVGYVAQWCQPMSEVTPATLGKHFDRLTELVLECLKESHPHHPIFTFPEEERAKWRYENLQDNVWSPRQCMEILYAMEEVLINRLHYHGSKGNYHHRENYFIDAALVCHQGIPITINVIAESVGRRLGVRTDPWYRGHFVLLWKSGFQCPDHPERVIYLDAFNSGGLLRPETYIGNGGGSGCPYRDLHCPKGPAKPMEVIERLTAGIEVAGRMSMRNNGHSAHLRSALELMFVINPKNLTYILHLARLYMLYNISVADLTQSITSMMEELPSEVQNHAENILQMFKVYAPHHQDKPLPTPQTRAKAPGVRFAVGMTMYHKQFNYLCVITGWDAKCLAATEWKQEMGVHWLKYQDDQPFYNVLVPDGTYRYAAQENLEPLKAGDHLNIINLHPDVGRYFETYQNGYYIPNRLKLAEYPDDHNVCRQFYCPGSA